MSIHEQAGKMGHGDSQPGGVEGAMVVGEGQDASRVSAGLPAKVSRQEAIEVAIEGLRRAESTEHIAERLGIPGRTLRTWVMLDERAEEARAAFFAIEMDQAAEELKNAPNGLAMSKARELLNHYRHLAKVRAKRYFGEDPAVQINVLTPEQVQIRLRQLEAELGLSGDS